MHLLGEDLYDEFKNISWMLAVCQWWRDMAGCNEAWGRQIRKTNSVMGQAEWFQESAQRAEWRLQTVHRWDRRVLGGTSEEDDALPRTWLMCQSQYGPAKTWVKFRQKDWSSDLSLIKEQKEGQHGCGGGNQILGHTGNGWVAPGGGGREFGLYVTALRSQERRQQGQCELINIKEHLVQCLMIVQCSAQSLIIGIFYYSYIVSSSVRGLYGTLWHRLNKVFLGVGVSRPHHWKQSFPSRCLLVLPVI